MFNGKDASFQKRFKYIVNNKPTSLNLSKLNEVKIKLKYLLNDIKSYVELQGDDSELSYGNTAGLSDLLFKIEKQLDFLSRQIKLKEEISKNNKEDTGKNFPSLKIHMIKEESKLNSLDTPRIDMDIPKKEANKNKKKI